jgi:hypothetical protein
VLLSIAATAARQELYRRKRGQEAIGGITATVVCYKPCDLSRFRFAGNNDRTRRRHDVVLSFAATAWRDRASRGEEECESGDHKQPGNIRLLVIS